MNDYLKSVKADSHFRNAMTQILKESRPIIPVYTVCTSVEERETLIETIKIKTGERKGFDLLYQILTGDNPV